MKKYLLLLSLGASSALYGVGCSDCECTAVAKSFFSVRPLYQTASPERVALFHDRLHAREDGKNGVLQVEVFGSKTTNSSKLAAYFGPFCKARYTVTSSIKDALRATGSNPVLPENRDIVAEFFNIYLDSGNLTVNDYIIPGVYEGSFCFEPEQTVIGCGLTWRQALLQMCDCNWLWLELSTPLTHVKNCMGLHEIVNSTGEPLTLDNPTNMTQAFRQSSWMFGRIDPCCKNSETGFADLEVKIGYEWLRSDCCFLEGYLGVLIPTGNRVTSRLLFEPIVGHRHHTGVMTGLSGIFDWWGSCENDCYARFAVDWNSLYLFEANETRSFDLVNRPWSRYMPVYINKEQAEQAFDLKDESLDSIFLHTPGINVFTKPMCVKPRFTHTFNGALLFNCKCAQAEIGYNMYARSAECVRLACCWEEGPALKAIDGVGRTSEVARINQPLAGVTNSDRDYDDSIIKECDLDLQSAAHPGVLTHTIYGSVGYNFETCCYPAFAGVGFSYEFADDNAGLERWVAWVKGGLSF